MNVKERILTIRLLEKLEKHPGYVKTPVPMIVNMQKPHQESSQSCEDL